MFTHRGNNHEESHGGRTTIVDDKTRQTANDRQQQQQHRNNSNSNSHKDSGLEKPPTTRPRLRRQLSRQTQLRRLATAGGKAPSDLEGEQAHFARDQQSCGNEKNICSERRRPTVIVRSVSEPILTARQKGKANYLHHNWWLPRKLPLAGPSAGGGAEHEQANKSSSSCGRVVAGSRDECGPSASAAAAASSSASSSGGLALPSSQSPLVLWRSVKNLWHAGYFWLDFLHYQLETWRELAGQVSLSARRRLTPVAVDSAGTRRSLEEDAKMSNARWNTQKSPAPTTAATNSSARSERRQPIMASDRSQSATAHYNTPFGANLNYGETFYVPSPPPPPAPPPLPQPQPAYANLIFGSEYNKYTSADGSSRSPRHPHHHHHHHQLIRMNTMDAPRRRAPMLSHQLTFDSREAIRHSSPPLFAPIDQYSTSSSGSQLNVQPSLARSQLSSLPPNLSTKQVPRSFDFMQQANLGGVYVQQQQQQQQQHSHPTRRPTNHLAAGHHHQHHQHHHHHQQQQQPVSTSRHGLTKPLPAPPPPLMDTPPSSSSTPYWERQAPVASSNSNQQQQQQYHAQRQRANRRAIGSDSELLSQHRQPTSSLNRPLLVGAGGRQVSMTTGHNAASTSAGPRLSRQVSYEPSLQQEGRLRASYYNSATTTATSKANRKKETNLVKLSLEGAKRRLGFKQDGLSQISIQRSEEVLPFDMELERLQDLTIDSSFADISYCRGLESSGSSPFHWSLASSVPRSPFIDGLGPGQVYSRQALVSPYIGDLKLTLCNRHGALEITVIRARRLHLKLGTTQKPCPYVKVYLIKDKKCIAKWKTMQAIQTLEPEYHQSFIYRGDFTNCAAQIIVWGDYGRRDRKSFMGIVQICTDDLELSSTITGWYKLFNGLSMINLFNSSKQMRQRMLPKRLEDFKTHSKSR